MSALRGVGLAQDTSADAGWAAYDDYVAAFQSRDLDRTAAFFRAPLVRFVGGSTVVAETDEDVRDWLRSSFARLDEIGCARVSAEEQHLRVLDPLLAVLRVRGTRYGRQDVPLEGFDVTYHLVRPTGSSPWRIGGVAAAMSAVQLSAVERAADRLLTAARSGRPCAPVRGLVDSPDLESAAAVQQLVTATRVAGGDAVIGCKVASARQVDGPPRPGDDLVLGVLFSGSTYVGGDTVPADAVVQPRVTAHVGLVLAQDLAADEVDLAAARAAVAYATPVLEIAGCRIREWDVAACDLVADNACVGAVVLGPLRTPFADLDPAGATLRLHHAGRVVTEPDGARVDPGEALAWAARRARELGRTLKAGDLVLTGALAPARPLRGGDLVRAHLGGLGAVQFTLDVGAGVANRSGPSQGWSGERRVCHGS